MKAAETKSPSTARVKAEGEKDFLETINDFLGRHERLFFMIALVATVLFSLLLFDARMSFATDDSTYVQFALNFLRSGSYPNFQGPLYPMVLALIIKVFGMRLMLIKLFSVLFMAVQVYLLYRAFRHRVPNLILFAGLFVIAFNAYILAYASSTFSESFYFMMQALAILVFFKLIDKVEQPGIKPQHAVKEWLLFGFVFLLLSLSKNAALFAIIAVILYFLVRKEWLNAVLSIASYALFRLPYELIMRAIFGDISSNQTALLLRKDFHDPSKGNVGIADLFERFFGNFGNYITVHTFKMLGLRGEGVSSLYTVEKIAETQHPMEASWFYGIIFIVLFGAAIYFAFKQNRYMLFLLLFSLVTGGVTFVALHTFWNQDRLILILLPFFFMAMAYALYGLARDRRIGWLKVVLPILLALVLLIQLGNTAGSASKRSKYVKHYMKGDMLYGYTPGIQNYAKICEWVGKNLTYDDHVVCSKPAEATVYGGKPIFTRLPNPLPQTADSILASLKEKKINYLLVDQTGFGNLGNLAQYLYQSKPTSLTQVQQEGGEIEAAFLFKINY